MNQRHRRTVKKKNRVIITRIITGDTEATYSYSIYAIYGHAKKLKQAE
jgi:hypothetical protein